MNYRAALRPIGWLLWLLGASLLFPLLLSLFEESELQYSAAGFMVAILVCIIAGAVLWRVGENKPERIHRKEGLFIVSVSWLTAGLIGSIPFFISGAIPGLVDAVFESISGFTTTGASILTDIESLPRSMLLWRSLTHWLGGMGIVVLFVAILPALGIGGKHLVRFEATGPEKSGIHPRIADTARTLWAIYASISLAEFLLLWLTGMPLFDAVCHTFGTMATGGFSTQNTSIAGYANHLQVIITVFMYICGVNFNLYYQLIRKNLRIFRDVEFWTYTGISLGTAAVIAVTLLLTNSGISLGDLVDSAFTASSIITTTGYGTADFETWPVFIQGLLVLLMFMGASAGSTGGGMKIIRVIILIKWAYKHLVHTFQPNEILSVRISRQRINPAIELQVMLYFLLYIGWFVLGIFVLLVCGHDLLTSFTASVASLSNIGPGLGMIGPTDNYSQIHMAGKLVLAVLMIVGRLEIFAVTALISREFWSK
jgi:trk system potassium uptake protein TrkH